MDHLLDRVQTTKIKRMMLPTNSGQYLKTTKEDIAALA